MRAKLCRTLRGVVLAAAVPLSCVADEVPGTEARMSAEGVCAAQMSEFVAARFGHTTRGYEFRWQEQKNLDSIWHLSQALVFVEECPGYHFFELNADFYKCVSQEHLGAVPRYVMYRSTGGGC